MQFSYSNRNRYSYKQQLEHAQTIPEIFEIVKSAVREIVGKDQAGLLLGLTVLPSEKGFHIGAYYSFDANMILMNKIPLQRIRSRNPGLYNPYIFHILLREYLISIGYYNEETVNLLTCEVSKRCFGSRHTVTRMAEDIGRFFKDVGYPETGFLPEKISPIEYIYGIDRSDHDYIG